MRRNKHINNHLQNAWNKYGRENFIFRIIEEVEDKTKLIEREQYYIDILVPQYNKRTIANSNLGIKYHYTEKSFEKNRLNPPMKGKKHSQETKQKIGQAHKGKKLSEKTKEKMSIAAQGHCVSEETKQKIGLGSRGRNAKLINQQVKEILEKYIPRIYSTRKLAKEYNVTQKVIWNIIKYKSYNNNGVQ